MRGARIGSAPRRGPPFGRILRYIFFLTLAVLLVARIFFVELVIVRGNTMAPSVVDGDILLVNRRTTPRIGDLVLVESADKAVLRRVMAQAGTRVASVDGVLALDESPLDTRTAGTFAYHDTIDPELEIDARPRRQQLLIERLPDGRKHEVLGDHVGASKPWVLTLPEIEVPVGQLFVLCDNRRRCPEDELSGLVRVDQITGVVSYLMWYGDGRVEVPSDSSSFGVLRPLRSR